MRIYQFLSIIFALLYILSIAPILTLFMQGETKAGIFFICSAILYGLFALKFGKRFYKTKNLQQIENYLLNVNNIYE